MTTLAESFLADLEDLSDDERQEEEPQTGRVEQNGADANVVPMQVWGLFVLFLGHRLIYMHIKYIWIVLQPCIHGEHTLETFQLQCAKVHCTDD